MEEFSIEKLLEEKENWEFERKYDHFNSRVAERYKIKLNKEDYESIRSDIENNYCLCYGKLFNKTRIYDNHYRVFVRGQEMIAVYRKPVIVTVIPIQCKHRIIKQYKREYGINAQITF